MSARRAALFRKVCEWVGPTLVPVNDMGGWPGVARLGGTQPGQLVALHVSVIGPHSRAAHEYRFQNPADKSFPVAAPNGALPLLVGVAQQGRMNILVVADGLALCRNHHRLFDRHRIWVSGDDHRIVWHPEILAISQVEQIAANLVENTRAIIAMPAKPAHRPRKLMFDQRYELTKSQYEWAA